MGHAGRAAFRTGNGVMHQSLFAFRRNECAGVSTKVSDDAFVDVFSCPKKDVL